MQIQERIIFFIWYKKIVFLYSLSFISIIFSFIIRYPDGDDDDDDGIFKCYRNRDKKNLCKSHHQDE
ncbi:hypothetical protein DERF_014915 [Dermatophagoides farinae]|uniref:Uncharacterized protein n=1 Tax=Dermatophagoides farinae TaxID=6954 RepID=A0A922HN96_DERFA|nr:hypothetical protein DERF_014915 [Dermatophagoides farinae]